MNAMLKPTGLALVGIALLLVSLCAQTGLAWPASPSYPESLGPIREYHSAFIHNEQSRQILGLKPPSLMLSSAPTKEKIILKGSSSSEQVQDLKAVNAVKQRDIVCSDILRKDSKSRDQSNFMDIDVQGRKELAEDDFEDKNAERFIGGAHGSGEGTGYQSLGNNMNIDVSGITVSAVNTVEGGSAIATSNIIIKPVQVIVYPSEVEEKLR